jgi:hypothetical protein
MSVPFSRWSIVTATAADECGLGRDSDDVGMPGELDRGEDTAVAEPGDYDAFSRRWRSGHSTQ